VEYHLLPLEERALQALVFSTSLAVSNEVTEMIQKQGDYDGPDIAQWERIAGPSDPLIMERDRLTQALITVATLNELIMGISA